MKRGLFSNPTDVVVLFSIFALVIVTVGFAITDIESQGVSTGDTTLFTQVESNVNSGDGLKGSADQASDVIDPSDEQSPDSNEESLITQGLQSLKQIGSSFQAFRTALTSMQISLGIPSVLIDIVIYTLIVAFFVVIYAWFRGKA